MNKYNLKMKHQRKVNYFKKDNFIYQNGELLISKTIDYFSKEIDSSLIFDDLNIKTSKKIKKIINQNIDQFFLINGNFGGVFSNFSFQLAMDENPDETIKKIFSLLNENGVLCMNLLTKNSMNNIIKIFYEIDEKIFNGYYQRFGPFIEVSDIIEKLSKYKFKDIVANIERLEINYSSLNNLRTDFKEFGISNYYSTKIPFKKKFLIYTTKVFDSLVSKYKYIPLEIEIATFTAWK